jgi:hypothetical protein
MGLITVIGLASTDQKVANFAVECYSDSGLTTLVDTQTAPAIFDSASAQSKMVGSMSFTGLVTGDTYYLRSCCLIPGSAPSAWSSTYAVAADDDFTGTGGGTSVTFGTGTPSSTASEGDLYFDTSTTPYTIYVYHSSAWRNLGSSGGGGGGGTGGAGFSSGSNSNGYWVQDPTGHLHQWGKVTTDINNGVVSVTFPTPFSSATGVSVNVSTKSSTDRITYVVDGSVTASGFQVGNNGSSGFAYWQADGPGTATTSSLLPLVVLFGVNSGTSGSNVGPLLVAPRAASLTKCVVAVKASSSTTALTIRIKKNGTDVFTSDPTISAGATSGTVTTFTALTATPLPVTAGDVFTLDITSGSSDWIFTAQLE